MKRTTDISPILDRHPSFIRGSVIATDIDNACSSPELELLLTQAIVAARSNPIDLDTDPLTARWKELYRQLEVNPNKFPPAHCNLLKRLQKPDAMLPFINKVVAIMNINSIDGKIPVGGDDLALIGSRLELRYANGSECFTPLGAGDALEHPDPGEVIYVCADKGEVMCRRWNWRNSSHTAITERTRTIAINIDGLGTDCQSTVINVRDRIADMLTQYCGASTSTALLDIDNPTFEFFA